VQKLDLGEKKRKCALGGGGEERKTLWPRKKSVHCRERETEKRKKVCEEGARFQKVSLLL